MVEEYIGAGREIVRNVILLFTDILAAPISFFFFFFFFFFGGYSFFSVFLVAILYPS